jgi:hypothetical protein
MANPAPTNSMPPDWPKAAAREYAERSLTEAQVLIRDLQTKLAHERLAEDEALEAAQRAETDRQTVLGTLHIVEAELAAERLARRRAEDALAQALEARQEVESRLRDAMAASATRGPSKPLMTRRATVGSLGAASGDSNAPDSVAGLHAGDAPASARMAEATTIAEDGWPATITTRTAHPN